MKAELNEASLDEFKEVNSPTTCPIAGLPFCTMNSTLKALDNKRSFNSFYTTNFEDCLTEDHESRIEGSTQGDGHRYDAHGPAAHQVLLIVGTVLERVVDADAEGQDKHQGKDDEVDGGESGVQHCGRA